MKSKQLLHHPHPTRIKIVRCLQGMVTLPCCLVQRLYKITISISHGTFCLLKSPVSAIYVHLRPLTLVLCCMLQSQVLL
ncbi:hypothetical protein N306_09417, partial [Opisthocomus hoazin]